jgi:serine/threonine protein kinase
MVMHEQTLAEEDSSSPTAKSKPMRLPYETRVLDGRYRVRSPIGRGQVADVYLGDDLLLERAVAIKIAHQCVVDDASRLERFRREAISLATVRSPHLVGVYDLGLTSEGAYLVMQHIDGQTIEEEIRRFGPMTAMRAATVLSQLLSGLAAMHDRGLVSRDIRSSNVLLDRNDKVVLLDLGIAVDARRAVSTVIGSGTPADHAIDGWPTNEFASDIYQVGLIMLFLLTGVDSARRSPRVGYEDLFQQLSGAFANVARRALDTDPAARFTSAVVMKDAVELALEMSRMGLSRERTVRSERRSPAHDSRPTTTMTAAQMLSLLADSSPTPPARVRVEPDAVAGKPTAVHAGCPPPAAAPALAAPTEHGRILIVDEDELFASTVSRILAPTYRVVVAHDAPQAYAHLEAGARFSVILCGLVHSRAFHDALLAMVPDQASAIVFMIGSHGTSAFLECISNKRFSKQTTEAGSLLQLVSAQISSARRAITSK